MQTRSFRNTDCIEAQSRVALRADETRVGFVWAIFDDNTTLVKFDDAVITEIVAPIDLIRLADAANDPAAYSGTLI